MVEIECVDVVAGLQGGWPREDGVFLAGETDGEKDSPRPSGIPLINAGGEDLPEVPDGVGGEATIAAMDQYSRAEIGRKTYRFVRECI